MNRPPPNGVPIASPFKIGVIDGASSGGETGVAALPWVGGLEVVEFLLSGTATGPFGFAAGAEGVMAWVLEGVGNNTPGPGPGCF